ncbi:MAG: winged helix-turn-helix domain-containing protein [Nanoarchaeota archaeon]|nr:winged helix-turn-helix domain-containing protein [Nanoarchaeota archaeon]MBU4301113.1 winged helix-turn-helix domain-containing protein [Nanoarchaeota archaeon]MBU4452433.1 winged helix-turn-helix domain-containing protein [Nanoarchaeota archaeon]MCG2724586.1 winged helix-turn-helix domain-containing protein [archaeon]
MELDRNTIKALSAETRLKILKTLAKQKKMPSELSREIGVSPSTVVGHLQNLESAGLVKRVETGHKWVYYTPTDKGRYLVQPRVPLQLALTLAAGIITASFGFLRFFSGGALSSSMQKAATSESVQTTASQAVLGAPEAALDSAGTASQSLPTDWIAIAMIVAGVAIIAYGIYNINNEKRMNLKSKHV